MSDVYVLNRNCEMIGSGAFGKVYKSGAYAVKLFNDNSGDEEMQAIDILKKIEAPASLFSLAEWRDLIHFKNDVYRGLVMQYANSNAHLESLHSPFVGLSYMLKVMDPVMKSVLEASLYLRRRGYVHADIKLSNILVQLENGCISSVKLSDFSFVAPLCKKVRRFDMSQFCIYRHHSQFTDNYEKNESFELSESHENWSLGVCILDLARRGNPCACGCTDNRADVSGHKDTARRFASAEHRRRHIVSIMCSFKAATVDMCSNESVNSVVTSSCDTYTKDALRLCGF